MMDTRAVVFDLYGTLIYLTDEKNPYKRLFDDLDFKTSEDFRQARDIALTENFENLPEFVRRIKPDTQVNLTPYQQEIEKELSSTSLYRDTKETLCELNKQKIKVGLISNLASPYKKPFLELGLDEYFDEVLFSCDVGLKKPDPRIYQRMIEKFYINPEQALMTGDNVRADVEGPISTGMNAVHLNRAKYSSNSISSLEEIFQYL